MACRDLQRRPGENFYSFVEKEFLSLHSMVGVTRRYPSPTSNFVSQDQLYAMEHNPQVAVNA